MVTSFGDSRVTFHVGKKKTVSILSDRVEDHVSLILMPSPDAALYKEGMEVLMWQDLR